MPLKIDFNINTIISLQWRTQKISGGGQSFVTIAWRHKSTLEEVPKTRRGLPRENFAKLHLKIRIFVHSGSKF